MTRMMKRLVGRRRGQTTVEYGIIVALIAIASISVIMIFGNQLRALFAGESKQLSGGAARKLWTKPTPLKFELDGPAKFDGTVLRARAIVSNEGFKRLKHLRIRRQRLAMVAIMLCKV